MDMRQTLKAALALAAAAVLSAGAQASWYWPFGDDGEEKPSLKLSDLVEQASLEIDDAIDAAAEGKMDEALEHYRKALDELDRVERENPAIAPLPEYASLRNKRAYVNAAIDSILLEQSRENAKAVQVTDTRELEKKFEERRRKRLGLDAPPVPAAKPTVKEEDSKDEAPKADAAPEQPVDEPKEAAPQPAKEERKPKRKAAAAQADKAEIDKALELRPDDAKALNMRARLEAQSGDWRAAEATLDRAIMTNPRSYHAYYNMAALILKFRPDSREAARRYYETGRDIGGPVHKGLEREFSK